MATTMAASLESCSSVGAWLPALTSEPRVLDETSSATARPAGLGGPSGPVRKRLTTSTCGVWGKRSTTVAPSGGSRSRQQRGVAPEEAGSQLTNTSAWAWVAATAATPAAPSPERAGSATTTSAARRASPPSPPGRSSRRGRPVVGGVDRGGPVAPTATTLRPARRSRRNSPTPLHRRPAWSRRTQGVDTGRHQVARTSRRRPAWKNEVGGDAPRTAGHLSWCQARRPAVNLVAADHRTPSGTRTLRPRVGQHQAVPVRAPARSVTSVARRTSRRRSSPTPAGGPPGSRRSRALMAVVAPEPGRPSTTAARTVVR